MMRIDRPMRIAPDETTSTWSTAPSIRNPSASAAGSPLSTGLTGRATWPARLATVILRWRIAALLAIHILCFTATYLLAFLIRFDGEFSVLQWEMALHTLPVVVGVKVLASLIMGSHRGWWRYATFPDLVNIAE